MCQGRRTWKGLGDSGLDKMDRVQERFIFAGWRSAGRENRPAASARWCRFHIKGWLGSAALPIGKTSVKSFTASHFERISPLLRV